MDKDELKELFSEFWKFDKKNITDEIRLDDETLKNKSSIRFYQFIAAVESNFDVKIQDIGEIINFGDLWDAINK